MITIKLYKNKSEENVLEKDIELLKTIEGTLKNDCSIETPNIIISNIDKNIFKNFNYFYIEEFGRYYNRTDVEILKNNIFSISGESDPLMSFKNDIYDNFAQIERSVNFNDCYIDDISGYSLDKDDYTVVKLWNTDELNHNCYILSCV